MTVPVSAETTAAGQAASESVLVVGAGVSGLAAAGLAKRLGMSVTLFDSNQEALTSAVAGAAASEGYNVVGPTWDAEFVGAHETVVMSPGVPPNSEIYSDCAQKAISEIEFGFRNTLVPVIAVTGTNGKTTVTRAIADSSGGKRPRRCGLRQYRDGSL